MIPGEQRDWRKLSPHPILSHTPHYQQPSGPCHWLWPLVFSKLDTTTQQIELPSDPSLFSVLIFSGKRLSSTPLEILFFLNGWYYATYFLLELFIFLYKGKAWALTTLGPKSLPNFSPEAAPTENFLIFHSFLCPSSLQGSCLFIGWLLWEWFSKNFLSLGNVGFSILTLPCHLFLWILSPLVTLRTVQQPVYPRTSDHFGGWNLQDVWS